MWLRRRFWQLFTSFLFVVVLTILLRMWISAGQVQSMLIDQKLEELEFAATLFEELARELIATKNITALTELCKRLAARSSHRYSVLSKDGGLIADSDVSPDIYELPTLRPELEQAFSKGTGVAMRYSDVVEKELLYYARRIEGSELVVRVSVPQGEARIPRGIIYQKLLPGGALVLLIIGILSFAIARLFSRSLEQMLEGVRHFASGDFSYRLRIPKTEEVGKLAEGLNSMAAQLDEKLKTVARQRNELDAILTSMREGVIATDLGARIVALNSAAAKLLDLDRAAIEGSLVTDLPMGAELRRLITECLAGKKVGESLLATRSERLLRTYVRPLYEQEGHLRGVLLVLHDETKLQRLESVRQEFVANVSHELKTPVTSIKGYVETLLDGAKDTPEELDRFLNIILRQSERLSALIEDLLSLARIQHGEETKIEILRGDIRDVVVTSVELYHDRAKEKGIELEVSELDSHFVKMNSALLEQALINLIDNAVKYSPKGSKVTVSAKSEADKMVLSVCDQGCGIEAKHLGRIFERFYRVDKGRSRDLGGTGLGLALVKHIARVHGGDVDVRSMPGKGSAFSLRLPLD